MQKCNLRYNKGKIQMLINKEILKRYFNKDRKESFVNMDLSIFDSLNELESNGSIKSTSNKVFTFGYLWLVSYLWKYSKYGEMEYTAKDIKLILGVSPIEKRIDYLIKQNGLLDNIGMLETTRDFPIYTNFSKSEGIQISSLSGLADDLRESFLQNCNSRYTCKKPLFQYERENKVGLMFSRDDVLPISLLEFTRIVLSDELGLEAFYVYAYLKLRCKLRGYTSVGIMMYELSEAIGFRERKLSSIIQNLEMVGLVDVTREYIHNESKTKIIGQHNRYTIKKGV